MEIFVFLNKWLGEIITFFGALAATYAFFRSSLNKLKPYTNIIESMEALNLKIDNISKEFVNNHGTSLKDQICNIEKSVDENTKLTKSIFYRQRWILDSRSEPIFEADEKGHFTWVNDAFVKFVKRKQSDLLDTKWKNIISENRRDQTFDHWNSAISEKRNFEETIHVKNKKGEEFSCMCVASIQEDGKYIGALTEITLIDSE